MMSRYLGLMILFALPLHTQPFEAHSLEHYQQTAKHIREFALKHQEGYRLLGELSAIGPRLSGSENSMKAIQWAERTMKDIGLDRVILQPVKVPYWVRGPVEEAFIVLESAKQQRPLQVAALGGSIGTGEEYIEGEVIEFAGFANVDSATFDGTGKIFFFNEPFDQSLLNTFRGYVKAVQQRVHGADKASSHGGIAALVRSVTSRDDNVPHVGSMHYSGDYPKVPTAAIGVRDAQYLHEALRSNPNLKVRMRLSCETLPDADSYNVIGDIIGSEYPDEYVVVAGHFDSWDKGDGAHDDGAGCIQALEVLHILKELGIRPKRTIRCVFFINEENGVRGGKTYGKESATAGLKHIAAIESDRGAFTPRGFFFQQNPDQVRRAQAWLPVLAEAGIDWVREGGSGVDIRQIKDCPLLIGYVPDMQRYFDFHHSANDVYQAVNPREMELGSAAMAILAYILSEEGL